MKLRRIAPLFLILALICTLAFPVRATDDADSYISQMINYYQQYGENAAFDVFCLLEDLAQINHEQADAWEKIMAFWSQCNREMDLTQEILPDGLPEDDSLCIVVLGYQLKTSGEMRDELIGRLKVALACAEKYPNSYIACTGGGTASKNRSVTEASQMADWLIRHGIDKSRIITEDDSMSTIQNAQFTTVLLSEQYPQIKNLALVTSDYHVLRGSLYFYTDSVLNTLNGSGIEYHVVGNAAYQTGRIDPDDRDTQTEGLASLAGVRFMDYSKISLATLNYITVSGEPVCQAGTELDLTVTAVYSNGYEKDVTISANYSGFDLAKAGPQTVTVSYTENEQTYLTHFDIEMLPAPTEATVPAETAPPTTAPAAVLIHETDTTSAPSPAIPLPVLLAAAAVLLALAVVLIVKIRRN